MPSPVTLTAGSASWSGPNGGWVIPSPPWSTLNEITYTPGSESDSDTLSFGAFGNAGVLPANATVVGVQLVGNFWALNASTDYTFNVSVTIGSKTSGNCVGSPQVLSTTVGSALAFGTSSTFPGSMTAPGVADVNTGMISASWQFSGPSGGPGMSKIFCDGCFVNIWYTVPANQVLPQCITVKPTYVERD